MTSPVASPLEETVLIVGVGLIGGSIASAVRARGVARRVIGLGRDQSRLNAAVYRGLLDADFTDPVEAAKSATFVVVCTPVTRIIDDVRALLPHLPKSALVTDAGSTKQRIVAELADLADQQPTFVGSHPIAGSDKQGFEHADANLFLHRLCLITPTVQHSTETVARVERFWQGLGMTTQLMDAAIHDETLARTSHVPHVVAAAMANSIRETDLTFTGTGFRDTTRIAAGDADLWTTILMENTNAVRTSIATVQEQLALFDRAMANGDAKQLRSLLASAKSLRDQLSENVEGPMTNVERD
ncbi:prephenate dehydrogenase/arogenate dehydrogenase family protein [bacterium]|nr:prephenate dehydrogenase/arogenate dehydrogenase family protein [bacterium]